MLKIIKRNRDIVAKEKQLDVLIARLKAALDYVAMCDYPELFEEEDDEDE